MTTQTTMNTNPDPMQEWAGFWLKEQQRYWQRWAQSHHQSSAPAELTAIAVQAWQQGNELWLNSISAILPTRLVEPITQILRQSQKDLQQAFQVAQARQQQADQPDQPSSTAAGPGPWFHSLNTAQDFDLVRLRRDPVWREYIQALNAFIQFHIQMTVESLTDLKAELASDPGHDLDKQLRKVLSDYQARLQSPHYAQVQERLINSLTAMSGG